MNKLVSTAVISSLSLLFSLLSFSSLAEFEKNNVESSSQNVNQHKKLDKKQREKAFLQAANGIRTKYDSQFIEMRASAQNHYAARMYRLTGEAHYITGVVNEVFQIHDRVSNFSKHIDSKAYRLAQANKLIDALPNTRRGKLRKAALEDTGEQRFALYVLYQLAKLDEYGLKHSEHDKIVTYLKTLELEKLILSKQFIKAYAAQVANYVYWAYQLEVGDWRKSLNVAFRKAYPDNKDEKLSKSQFQNKIYGLTHIVIAASEYYQTTISEEEFGWIIEYFDANIERILDKTKSDVHAEVGISYLLVGKTSDKALLRLKAAVVDAIDPNKDMILSVKGDDDISKGEHRNILAYALLAWPQELTRGPQLLDNEKWKKALPVDYHE